jgi:hypothetical protein
MSGLVYIAPNVSLIVNGLANPLATGGTAPFDTGKKLKMSDEHQGPALALAFARRITAINGTAWNINTNLDMDPTYLFVFLIPGITPPEGEFAGGGQQTGTTAGITTQWLRSPCIYQYQLKRLAHETAHGLGLPHTFYDANVKYPKISSNANDSARSIGISSTQDLYSFYDVVNSTGLASVLAAKFGQPATLSLSERGAKIGDMNQTRMYTIYQTHNLLDYQNQANLQVRQEQLRKDQIEQLRYYA